MLLTHSFPVLNIHNMYWFRLAMENQNFIIQQPPLTTNQVLQKEARLKKRIIQAHKRQQRLRKGIKLSVTVFFFGISNYIYITNDWIYCVLVTIGECSSSNVATIFDSPVSHGSYSPSSMLTFSGSLPQVSQRNPLSDVTNAHVNRCHIPNRGFKGMYLALSRMVIGVINCELPSYT